MVRNAFDDYFADDLRSIRNRLRYRRSMMTARVFDRMRRIAREVWHG